MKPSKLILAIIALALMAGTAAALSHARFHQQLGLPGVKTRPMPSSGNLEVVLPETLDGYTSVILTNGEKQLSALPPDTSFRLRRYEAADGFWAQVSVVVMGSDRSSLHKPEICMTGQGWSEDEAASEVVKIHLDKPQAYDLPVNKLIFSKAFQDQSGTWRTARGIYVYWFVDATHYTPSAFKWMLWWVPRDLLLNNILERWAYISYFTACAPGQEAAAYERLEKLIGASVPEYQLVPPPEKGPGIP